MYWAMNAVPGAEHLAAVWYTYYPLKGFLICFFTPASASILLLLLSSSRYMARCER